MQQQEVKLTVRFVDEDAEKHNVDLLVHPTITLARVREQLATETGTAKAEWIALSLHGRSLSLDHTLRQVYGGASVFGSALDARVEAVREEKEPPRKTSSCVVATTPTSSLVGTSVVPNHSGYHLLNEDKHDSELQCPICKEMLLDPVVLPCCENTLCRGCLRNSSCPFDRKSIDVAKLKEPLRLVRNMLERVEVQCKDCQRVMKRGLKGELFAKHVQEECPLVCVYGCGQSVTRAAMSAHEKQCQARVVPCSAADVGCPFVGARGTMADHERACRLVEMAPFVRRIDALERKNAALESQMETLRALEAFVERQFPGWNSCMPSGTPVWSSPQPAPDKQARLEARLGLRREPQARVSANDSTVLQGTGSQCSEKPKESSQIVHVGASQYDIDAIARGAIERHLHELQRAQVSEKLSYNTFHQPMTSGDVPGTELLRRIRMIVALAKEPVGLKTLLQTLERDLGLGKGSLQTRQNEVRDLLVEALESVPQIKSHGGVGDPSIVRGFMIEARDAVQKVQNDHDRESAEMLRNDVRNVVTKCTVLMQQMERQDITVHDLSVLRLEECTNDYIADPNLETSMEVNRSAGAILHQLDRLNDRLRVMV